jgi:hypothetical protein
MRLQTCLQSGVRVGAALRGRPFPSRGDASARFVGTARLPASRLPGGMSARGDPRPPFAIRPSALGCGRAFVFDPAHGGGRSGPWPPHACRGQGSTGAMGAVEGGSAGDSTPLPDGSGGRASGRADLLPAVKRRRRRGPAGRRRSLRGAPASSRQPHGASGAPAVVPSGFRNPQLQTLNFQTHQIPFDATSRSATQARGRKKAPTSPPKLPVQVREDSRVASRFLNRS